jgi:hypothetical protein
MLSRRRALAALLVAAQLPLLVGMAEAQEEQPALDGPPPQEEHQALVAPPPNNIVGLNLARLHQPRFIWAAAQIANANGGSWGYVTILLTNQDRDSQLPRHLLQQVLDRCYEARLQPIVRVGTRFDANTGIWERPTDDDPALWRALFEQVKWPNRTVWVIPANEPNLGREWGGAVDVAAYARYLDRFIRVFSGSDRFKVVNAPLNLSNPHNPPEMVDAFEFLAEHQALTPAVFDNLPGWASNSYKIDGVGDGPRYTHLGYDVELEQIGRDMPVLVTESGVLHRHGEDEIAQFFVDAYRDWQADRRVIAATPLFWDPDFDNHWMFTLNDKGDVETGSATYRALRELPRVAGSPHGSPPFGNTPKVSASAVKSRPLPVFLPDPMPALSSLEETPESAP